MGGLARRARGNKALFCLVLWGDFNSAPGDREGLRDALNFCA
jgi:hypothetical protein